jgi:membrane protease YdiL (CAAX protease family)
MIRWGRLAGAYVVLGVVALALVWSRGGSPLLHPSPRWALSPAMAHAWSLGLGVAFGVLLVIGSRFSVHRYVWARRLHTELRPFASSLSGTGLVVLALLSSVGEELLFRSLLQPWMGLLPQALLFGLVHQLPGPSRWVWASWAFVVGLVLGAMFEWTGSLLGPIAAHALVNALNLDYLKRHDADPARGNVGGLIRLS